MADTSVGTSHDITAEQWSDLAFREYVNKLVMKPFMGMSPEAVIHVREDLMKKDGDALTFNLAAALSGSAITGESDVEGSEEAMNFYGQRVVLDQVANAVKFAGALTLQRAPFDLKMEAMHALTTWMAQEVETDVFTELAAIDGTDYGSASEGSKDTWVTNNSDRVLFGEATANLTGTDHSAALAQIADSTGSLDFDIISLAKRIAQTADPQIRPVRIENGEEYYVAFLHNLSARDLKATSGWQQAQREAQLRGTDNPIFTGMLGMYDGVILKESPKVTLDATGGAGGIQVAANVLCGAQSVLMAQGGYENGERVQMVEDLFDYRRKPGFLIQSLYGMEKARFNSKDHGIVTFWTSAVSD